MTLLSPSPSAATTRWVCPFCPLLCDSASVSVATGDPLTLAGIECARAAPALAHFRWAPSTAQPRIDGEACDLDAAVAAAARLLAASHQPLFGGLGTDVSGARALYPLACATGAICDPAAGQALMHAVRALQDRGGFTTTMAEVRTRADLIVLFGAPGPNAADFLRRAGVGESLVASRHLAFIGHEVPDELSRSPNVSGEQIAWQRDAFTTASTLAALVAAAQCAGLRPG